MSHWSTYLCTITNHTLSCVLMHYLFCCLIVLIVGIHHRFRILSAHCWWKVGLFAVLTMTNNSAMSVLVHVLWWLYLRHTMGCKCRCGAGIQSALVDISDSFQNLLRVYISTSSIVEESQYFRSHHSVFPLACWFVFLSSGYRVISNWLLISISFVTNEVKCFSLVYWFSGYPLSVIFVQAFCSLISIVL